MLEGVYVVRYFLGGSSCCVAESKEFQVVIHPNDRILPCCRIAGGKSWAGQ